MWLYNPPDPHSTPTGADGLFGNRILEFNVNVPPYWRLKYRPTKPMNDYATPFAAPYFIPYDILLEFDYENMENPENGYDRYRWNTKGLFGLYDGKTMITGAGEEPELDLYKEDVARFGRDIYFPHNHKHSIGDIIAFYYYFGWHAHHDPVAWELYATKNEWFLKEGPVNTPFGTVGGAELGKSRVVYLLQHRESGGPVFHGPDTHCHFEGLGTNRFLYQYTEFRPGLGSLIRYEQTWRPNITIEPYWP